MKLFTLLTSLSSEDLKGVKKAVQSPLFNTNKRIIILFDFLKRNIHHLENTAVFKNQLYEKIFPKESLNNYKLYRIFGELQEIIEDYLLHIQLKKDKYRREIALTKVYNELDLYDVFKKKTEKLVEEIETYKYPDSQLLQDKMFLLKNLFSHNATHKSQEIEYLTKAVNALNLYYVNEQVIVKLVYQVVNRYKKTPLILPLEKELTILESSILSKKHMNYWLYTKIHQLKATGNNDDYLEISNLYEKHAKELTEIDRKTILNYLISYCVVKNNEGDDSFIQQLFLLYKNGLETDIFFNDRGKLGDILFKNIAFFAIQAKEFVWAETFIHQYIDCVETPYQEEIKSITLGALYFYRKEFEKAITILKSVVFKSNYYVVQAKGFLLRSYFELFLQDQDYYALLVSYTATFYKYLTRASLSKDKKQGYVNFVNFIKRITNDIHTNKEINVFIEKWRTDLALAEYVVFSHWCEQKLKELEGWK